MDVLKAIQQLSNPGAPGWLSQLSIQLLISAQVMISQSWDLALSQASAGHGACLISSVSLSASLSSSPSPHTPPVHMCTSTCSLKKKERNPAQLRLLAPFYQWANRFRRIISLKVTQLLQDRTETETQINLSPKCMLTEAKSSPISRNKT